MRALFNFLAIFVTSYTFAQSSDNARFSKDLYNKQSLNLNFETDCSGRITIDRDSKNIVTFMFFQSKSDTVVVYLNDNKVFEKYIVHDSNLVSTDYTNVDLTKEYLANINNIVIVYKNAKSYFEFLLDKNYPVYGIYFLGDKYFYVSGRKCQMIIK